MKPWLKAALQAVGIVAGSAITTFAISPPFATPWTPTYEAIPGDTESEALGASRIRDLKAQIRQRMQQDHSWLGDGNDGYHNQITLLQQTAACPTPAFDGNKTGGVLCTQQVGGEAELFYADNNGHLIQLTQQGSVALVTVPPGAVFYTASAVIPSGYLIGNGQAISRTTFQNLFNTIGTTYGNGDGSTTFNIPDCRARYVAGGDGSNTTGRLTANTPQGVSAAFLGNVGGEQSHTLTVSEMPPHNHGANSVSTAVSSATSTVSDPGHSHTIPLANGTGGSNSAQISVTPTQNGTTGAALTGITVSTAVTTNVSTATTIGNNGSGLTHNLIPPSIVFNCMIKT